MRFQIRFLRQSDFCDYKKCDITGLPEKENYVMIFLESNRVQSGGLPN